MIEKKMQEDKSLCEKSMELMLNIIKLSSFSLATTVNLGDKHDTGNRPVNVVPLKSLPSSPSNSQMSKSKSSQAPLSKSYLMEEDPGDHCHLGPSPHCIYFGTTDDNDGDFSDYIKRFHRRTKNEVNTDGKATAYIRKFHQKNSRDYTLASSTALPLVLPPPPPSPKK